MFMIAAIKQYHWVPKFVISAVFIFIFVAMVIQLQNSPFSMTATSYFETISIVETLQMVLKSYCDAHVHC
jgi:hypothetical protein